MIGFTIRRIIAMIPVLLGVLLIVFTLSHFMPGDPVLQQLGTNYTPEQYEALERQLGLDKPFFVQFWNYLVGVVTHFDLGTSYSTHRAVSTMIFENIGTTLKLGILSCVLTMVIGVPLGILSAIKQYSVADVTVTTVSMIFAALPGFWLGLMMMLLFSLNLGWLPSSGIGTWQQWIMPVLAQGLMPVALITRMTRSSMLEVIRQDYIDTAYAKGCSDRYVIWRHALKNALIPVITVFGMQMSMIFGSTIITEMIFSMPGVGTMLMRAITGRDYPTIVGVVLVISLCVCLINIFVDLAYTVVDPRIKEQFSGRNNKKRYKAVLKK